MNLAMDRKIVMQLKDDITQIYANTFYYMEANTAAMLKQLDVTYDVPDIEIEAAIRNIEKKTEMELDEHQVEAVKEAIAAEKEKQASENSAGWVPIQQNDNATALMNMQDGATTGFVAVKGDASYAQVKVGDTTLLLLSDGIYQDGEHTYAMYCDVYGIGEDAAPVQIGKLLSEGTAYPICVGTAGFYVTCLLYTSDAADEL